MPENVRVLYTEEEIKIIADPYRNRIVKAFLESPVPLTVTQAANIMGEVPANVHYHLKKLLKIDILVLDHIEIVKGINAKYYRLKNEVYRLSTSDESDNKHVVNKQRKRIQDLMYSELEEFRKEIDDLPILDPKSETPKGYFGKRDIYLTDEEFIELSNFISDYLADKMVKDTSKNKYSALLGIFIKAKKS